MAKRKGNKKNKRNKLLLLIMLLSLSVLLLVMSTYAWFTSNRSVSVESLDVNVSTVNGLQISTDATNWKARVLKNDISGASYTGVRNFLPDTLDHMSTIGEVDSNGFMKMFHGVVNADQTTGKYKLSATAVNEISRSGNCVGDGTEDGKCGYSTTNGDQIYFVAFDLYFKVDALTNVVLTPESKVEQVIEAGDVDTGIKNTVRVAFVNEGHVDPGATAASAQALKAGSSVIIWEPNSDTHTDAGIANATNVYGLTPTSSGGSNLAYKGVKAAFSESANIFIDTTGTNTTYFANVTPTIVTKYGYNTNQTFATLQPGVTKYRVYWWVEGQDVDTENGATGKHMTLDLAFAIA